MSSQPQRPFGPVKPWLLARNIPKKVSVVRLTNLLGLGRDDKVYDRMTESSEELVRDVKIMLFDSSIPHIMSIVAKHNFTILEGAVIRIELHPPAKYNEMHEVYVEVGAEVALKKEIKAGQPSPPETGPAQYHIFFTTKQSAFDARGAIIKPGRDARRVKYINDHDIKFIWIKNVGPHVQDFWVPPVIKGNVIAVPINVASSASTSVGRAVTSPAKIHADWCNSAFVAYETLYNMSARSAQGKVSISSMAWGSQLDISTFRMHYGSRFTSFEQKSSIPVVSSSTVEMRQYGDKDSAAEVLSIRHNGRVNDNSDAITEGINMTAKGTILSMKCLESGHLVTSTDRQGLHVWDMKENNERNRTPVVFLEAKEQQGNLWMDAKRMDVCSVDREGVLAKWDLTRAVTSDSKFPLPEDKSFAIDLQHEFYACSVSLHETDSTVLTVSDRHSQVVRWDMRANGPVQSSLSCLRRVNREPSDRYKGVKLRSTMPHPLIGCEWSPHNPHEFMTTSVNAIRIWDVRKMTDDLHCRFFDIGDKIQKAQWSPHKPDVFGILGQDGLFRITKLQIPQIPQSPSSYFDVLHSEELFVHLGHTLCVTDFSWCPYLEDVICTVAAGFDREPGGIQVWRPRNLYDSNENEEP
ncbi:Histone-binding protein rbbp4 [Podila epicladia]|nr:Histone-binding protein rbbp4 [Podila epicladia]